MAVDYSQAEKDRELLIKQRQRNTARSFEAMRKKIDEQIATMNMSTVSEKAKRQQLEEIRNQLQKSLGAFYSNLEDGLKSDMVSIGESVLNDSEAFYNSLNMPISMSITSFPVEVMENVINGSVYKEKWFLSNALWGDYQSKLDDINQVITEGIGMNLSSFEIAQQLEQFVDPSAMKPSATIVTPCLQDPETGKLYSMDYVKRHPEKDWSNFREKTSRFRYGKVDYNAQRLARTLVSHAYQQNVVRQAQANPFATGVKWEASGGERMCEICEERDGKIFPIDDVPMDHPNGMCTFTVETPSMMEMSNTLADWVNGEPTDYDDQLNAYYEGRPIDHKSAANASGKDSVRDALISKIANGDYKADFRLDMHERGLNGEALFVGAQNDEKIAAIETLVTRMYDLYPLAGKNYEYMTFVDTINLCDYDMVHLYLPDGKNDRRYDPGAMAQVFMVYNYNDDQAPGKLVIAFNREQFSIGNVQKWIFDREEKIKNGSTIDMIGGSSIEFSIAHEWGHVASQHLSNAMVHSDEIAMGYWEWYKSLSKDEIRNGLSDYATTNRGEFEAECMAELMMPNPRPLAIKYKEYLEAAIEKGY